MEIYKNIDNDSNVLKYEIGDDFITVEFNSIQNPRFYKYTYLSAGQVNVEEMKKLALLGDGLNSFIKTNVNKSYESKW